MHVRTLSSSISLRYALPYVPYLPTGRGSEQIACGCMCRLDVTLAQSSSIAPDSSPRRVHLDAAVRGRLLRRAHLESLQHPASTSRGKRFPSIGLGVDPRFLPLPSSFFPPIRNFSPRPSPRSYLLGNRRVVPVVESDGLWRTCGWTTRVPTNFRVAPNRCRELSRFMDNPTVPEVAYYQTARCLRR